MGEVKLSQLEGLFTITLSFCSIRFQSVSVQMCLRVIGCEASRVVVWWCLSPRPWRHNKLCQPGLLCWWWNASSWVSSVSQTPSSLRRCVKNAPDDHFFFSFFFLLLFQTLIWWSDRKKNGWGVEESRYSSLRKISWRERERRSKGAGAGKEKQGRGKSGRECVWKREREGWLDWREPRRYGCTIEQRESVTEWTPNHSEVNSQADELDLDQQMETEKLDGYCV